MKLTIDIINGLIDTATYHHFDGTTCVVCLLRLKNGCHVIGQSSCIDESNFDVKIGQKVAYDKAVAKIWELEGYAIKSKQVGNGSDI